MNDDDEMFYAHFDKVEGLLQRGRGLGAVRALREPQVGAGFVYDGIRRDWRWDGTDDRSLYLARLVQDLGLSAKPVVDQLREDDEDACLRAAEVLELLAVAGSDEAREALRTYVREGRHWVAVLESFAARWPVEWWEDLGGVARARIGGEAERPWFREPWPRFGIEVQACSYVAPPLPDADGLSDSELLAVLADSDSSAEVRVAALRALRGREPTEALLPLVPLLGAPDGRRPLVGLRPNIDRLGVLAMSAAGGWARDERPWLSRLGADVLADHPGPEAVPALVQELVDQWEAQEWCGPDRTAGRLARLGPQAVDAAPYLRRFWLCTPHSYERAAYLEALAAIAPVGLDYAYTESLWDCEEQARVLAIESAPGSAHVLGRIATLRDDPMEAAEVRVAAEVRLSADG
ncbi:hypothetical protein OG216_20810 [Streptomycetaceae bacterium NBC_01309]